MNATTLTRPNAPLVHPISKLLARQNRPAKPDNHLWKIDKDKAFEAGVQWFLAVSRKA